jgi:CheY-like chemotaxis protein
MSSRPSSALLDALDIGLVLVAEGDRILHANPIFTNLCEQGALTGMLLEDALGSPVTWDNDTAAVLAVRPDGVTWSARLSRRAVEGESLITVQVGPSAEQLAAATRKIAHDINNQLQVISISGGTLLSSAPPGSATWEDAQEITDAVEKTHRMLARLQHLARSVPPPPEPPKPLPEASAGSILLVESHVQIGEATARLLTRCGYRTTLSTTADETLALFASGSDDFKLAIISMQLKQTTGLVLARMLRRATPDLPVILCVTGPTRPSPQECGAAGVVAVIEKPFSHAELTRLITEFLA